MDRIKLLGGPLDGKVLDLTSPRSPHIEFDAEDGKQSHHYAYKVQVNKYVYQGTGPKGRVLIRPKRRKQP